MTLIVKGKKVSFIGFIILLLGLFSISYGQRYCGGIYVICDVGDCICTNDENQIPAQAHCAQANQALLMSGDEDAFDADFASKVIGKKVTVDDLKKDTTLRTGLKNGKIKTKEGKTYTFTPINKVKTQMRRNIMTTPSSTVVNGATVSTVIPPTTNTNTGVTRTNLTETVATITIQPIEINQMSLEFHFKKIIQTDGIDKALENYEKLRTDSLIKTPPAFLEVLGNKFLSLQKYPDAIKVFESYALFNKFSITAYFNLARAYESSYYSNKSNTEHKEKAIRNYELVLSNKTNDQTLKNSAAARLNVLRN